MLLGHISVLNVEVAILISGGGNRGVTLYNNMYIEVSIFHGVGREEGGKRGRGEERRGGRGGGRIEGFTAPTCITIEVGTRKGKI